MEFITNGGDNYMQENEAPGILRSLVRRYDIPRDGFRDAFNRVVRMIRYIRRDDEIRDRDNILNDFLRSDILNSYDGIFRNVLDNGNNMDAALLLFQLINFITTQTI